MPSPSVPDTAHSGLAVDRLSRISHSDSILSTGTGLVGHRQDTVRDKHSTRTGLIRYRHTASRGNSIRRARLVFGVSGFMYSWLMRSELGGIGEQVIAVVGFIQLLLWPVPVYPMRTPMYFMGVLMGIPMYPSYPIWGSWDTWFHRISNEDTPDTGYPRYPDSS